MIFAKKKMVRFFIIKYLIIKIINEIITVCIKDQKNENTRNKNA